MKGGKYQMNLDVYNTHMELYPYTKDDYPIIEKDFTSVDKFSGMEVPCGYMIDDGKLYLPRGAHIAKIERLCGVDANYIMKSDPFEKMNRKHYSISDPRDELQEKSIEFLKENIHQQSLTLRTGMGKTYCVAYASTELGLRTLIITPNERLKQQWLSTYSKMFDYRPKDLMNIAGSSIMEGIMEDLYDPCDVYMVNHQTLRSYMNSHNGYMLHQFFKKLNIGIKVYDESHMEFANIITTDYYSNTDRTWYLTATFSRSDKTEAVCFKRAFNSVSEFGYVQSTMNAVKHTIYHVVRYNSHISPKDRSIAIPFGGMAQPNYTLIPVVEGGCKQLGNLNIGDMIFDSHGNPTKIIDIFEHTQKDVYQITFGDGRVAECCIDHLWEVNRTTWENRNETRTVSTRDILENNYRTQVLRNPRDPLSTAIRFVYKYRIRNNELVKYAYKPVPVDPYTLGVILGNGCVTGRQLNISSPDVNIIKHICEINNWTWIVRPSNKWLYTFKDEDGHLVKVDKLFEKLTSVIGSKFYDKSIPNEYIYNSIDVRLGIIQGLMDTDGSISLAYNSRRNMCYSTLSYSSSSEILLSDIQMILRSIGINSTIGIDRRSEIYSTKYHGRLNIMCQNKYVKNLFRCNKNKVDRAIEIGNYPDFVDRSWTSIVDIKNTGRKEDMRCILVDNPEHLYLTQDYVVTHNTAVSYGKYAFFRDQNHTAYNMILQCLHILDDVEGKILIFVPLIDAVDDVVKRLKQDYPNKSVAAYHSRISKDEKESAEKKDIIVSTIKSCGTGVDIKGLRAVICQEPIASKVISEQLFGRIRPYKVINDKGEEELKDTYFFDCIDICIPPVNFWWRSRFKKYETLAKEVIYLDINN